MDLTPTQTLQFYISSPRPCPYLEGQTEMRLLTHLPHARGAEIYELLSKHGFRRSQGIAYRPHCPKCTACQSVKVPIAQFEWTKSFKRVMAKNKHITRAIVPAKASHEHFSLFHRYVTSRHGDGGMADMTALDFAAMIEETTINTHMVEYRLEEQLIAAILLDTMQDGISLVYSFFDPELPALSLGTFMVLDTIIEAAHAKMQFAYLGYFVEGSRNMSYKAKFQPLMVVGEDKLPNGAAGED